MNTKIFQHDNNIDRNEISKFESLSSCWWNPVGKLKILHRINPFRLKYIAHHSDGLFGKTVLDIGCGGGILSESIAREGAKVTGIDVGFKSIHIARLHALKNNMKINYIQETAEEHARKCIHDRYDIVICMEVLEHVPYPQRIVQACANLVKPGGEVFFSTINRNIKSWIVAIFSAEYVLNLIPKGTHNIKKFIKPSELLSWIDETSLKEKHITGLHYNPLTDRFRMTSNISVNYMVHTRSERFL